MLSGSPPAFDVIPMEDSFLGQANFAVMYAEKSFLAPKGTHRCQAV